jgi:predicted DNA-binding transcriptional regulator AlpA
MQLRRILKTADAAAYIAVGKPTLEKWRLTGEGPRFVRLGARSVGYDVHDLDAWVEARKRKSTSECA